MQARSWKNRLADPSERTLAWLLLAPAVLLLLLVVAYPVGRLIVDSFYDIRITRGTAPRFIGFDNYIYAFGDVLFWHALKNTMIITIVTVPGALVVGLGLAMLANLPFKRKWPVRLALLMPWALPLAFVGMIFAWFFHSEYGVANDLLRRVGLEQQIWFNSTALTMMAICIATIWKTSSFMALILLAGLQTIPASLYQAAEVDGATRWNQFTEITLPLLLPSMLVALIFRTLTAIQSFDIPYNMSGPGEETKTLAMYIQGSAVDYLDIGYSSALAVFMFLLSMATTFVYLKFVRADKE
ncbi:carbohydrate ABC transporter permease [Massilia sp. TWR1-2-2]|uniref:carbohydrate ABC transporter permease n=1 Tax=Massilia sp. TWR1-2-2 TaxID=2804584 RepID=UPI003CF0678A